MKMEQDENNSKLNCVQALHESNDSEERFAILQKSWASDAFFAPDSQKIYLDHNATAPLAPWLKSTLSESLESWGNPSSIHWAGRKSKEILRTGRKEVAQFIGASPLEIIFTSGGSEANNLALRGVYDSLAISQDQNFKKRKKWITSKLEHPSVLETLKSLQKKDPELEIEYIKVHRGGKLDWDHYSQLIDENVAVVSVMLANNETGTIFPIQKMAEIAHQQGALFHVDAVQALGKIGVDVQNLGVDLASFSGHKFYSLKGAGFLYCRKGTQIERQISGGGQERHRRSGTENILAIQSMALMCRHKQDLPNFSSQMTQLRDQMQSKILKQIDHVQVNGGQADRLPNTMNITIEGVDGESLLMNLDLKGFAVSTGAACSSGSPEPSAALMAMGLSHQEAQSSLRVSLGWGTSSEHIDHFVETLVKVVERLRKVTKESLH